MRSVRIACLGIIVLRLASLPHLGPATQGFTAHRDPAQQLHGQTRQVGRIGFGLFVVSGHMQQMACWVASEMLTPMSGQANPES